MGGDGTHRAAYGISQACLAEGIKIGVSAIPKTIDNDVAIIDRSFGFTTALDIASEAVRCALTEVKIRNKTIPGYVKMCFKKRGKSIFFF